MYSSRVNEGKKYQLEIYMNQVPVELYLMFKRKICEKFWSISSGLSLEISINMDTDILEVYSEAGCKVQCDFMIRKFFFSTGVKNHYDAVLIDEKENITYLYLVKQCST